MQRVGQSHGRDNNVSRTIPIVDNRDIVSIAAFRRGVLAGKC
ncbi:MAG: hypothetical protein R3A12_09925 [Ignavibacteria bacterium]